MRVSTEYIHHSSYTLDIGDCFFVFDYFDGDLKLPDDKKIYFFVSHTHSDHFSPKIFNYYEKVQKYIISNDVNLNKYQEYNEKICAVKPDNNVDVDDMNIKTYLSTDAGVAFMINIFDKNIFFSGDLNDWYWDMEDSENARVDMHNRFRKEIEKIRGIKIDIAYFLVDPRQADQFDLGGKQVLELMPRNFLPMHFWGDFSITEKFKSKYEKIYIATKIYTIKHKNQIIDLEI